MSWWEKTRCQLRSPPSRLFYKEIRRRNRRQDDKTAWMDERMELKHAMSVGVGWATKAVKLKVNEGRTRSSNYRCVKAQRASG
jgi:hypothetical protein